MGSASFTHRVGVALCREVDTGVRDMNEDKSTKSALTRKQLASRLGVHVESIKRWERIGRLTPRHFGPRTIRYTAEYVEMLERDGIPDSSPASKLLTLIQS